MGNLIINSLIHVLKLHDFLNSRFSVKTTEDKKESMAFLTYMTRDLRAKYHELRLTSCTVDDVTDNLVEKWDTTLPIFAQFNDNSRKNKPLTTSDMFVRMLVQQHGVTVSMANVIVEKYPTIGALMRAYENCDTQEEKEELLTGLVYESGTKKIRSATSKVLAWLYNDKSLN